MLENLFTSKTRIALLNLFLFNQDREYYLREIARIISISPIYTSKELDNLLKSKIVKKKKVGNLTIYSLDKKNKIISELRSIFLKNKNE